MCLAVFSTNEFERRIMGGCEAGRARTAYLGLCPLYEHRHPFSSNSLRFDSSTKFVQFFGNGLDLIEHQAGNDQSAPRLDGRPKSVCGFPEEIAIQVGGHNVKGALRSVLQDVRTKQFQAADIVQMSIRFCYSNGGRVRIETEHPFCSES